MSLPNPRIDPKRKYACARRACPNKIAPGKVCTCKKCEMAAYYCVRLTWTIPSTRAPALTFLRRVGAVSTVIGKTTRTIYCNYYSKLYPPEDTTSLLARRFLSQSTKRYLINGSRCVTGFEFREPQVFLCLPRGSDMLHRSTTRYLATLLVTDYPSEIPQTGVFKSLSTVSSGKAQELPLESPDALRTPFESN